MPRVTRGFKARRRRNKILSLAKGFRGGKHRLFRTATEAVDRALCYAYHMFSRPGSVCRLLGKLFLRCCTDGT